MEELEALKKDFMELNNKRIKLETIVEQAKQQCESIEQKYNIKNEQELKQLLDEAEQNYTKCLADAVTYLADVRQALIPYENLL